MKKQFLISALALTTIFANAQEVKKTNDKTGLFTQDKNGGTNVNFGIGTSHPNYRLEVFGTSKFHSNASVDCTLNVGNIKLLGLSNEIQNAAWQSPVKRIMLANQDGFLTPMAMGTANQVILGDGTLGNFPNFGQWLTSGNNLYWNTGNVSIGSAPNSFKLNVEGDARISHDLFVNNNMYVGGGIVISDKIQGVTEVKGWDFKVENDLQVTGATRFNGTAQLDQGFTFDGSKGIKFIPGQDNGGIFRYGNNNLFQPSATACAAAPTTNVAHQFGGIVQVFDPNDPSTGLLNFQTWTGGSSIDASVGGQNNPATLLLNYFCGNDVAICTGTNGGRVAMGKEVSIGGAWPVDPNTALNIRANFTRGLAIQNANALEVFSVMNDGKTKIFTNNTDAFDIVDATTSKVNFRVKNTGETWARRVIVQLADYPDYVFAKNYALMPLDVLEKFIAANKHLPNVPSAKEIETNGADIGELNKIQMEKIEELTLYIIEMKKEIEALKKQVNNGK